MEVCHPHVFKWGSITKLKKQPLDTKCLGWSSVWSREKYVDLIVHWTIYLRFSGVLLSFQVNEMLINDGGLWNGEALDSQGLSLISCLSFSFFHCTTYSFAGICHKWWKSNDCLKRSLMQSERGLKLFGPQKVIIHLLMSRFFLSCPAVTLFIKTI